MLTASDSPAHRSGGLEVLLAGVIALVALLPGIGLRDLWNPDEPRYAQVANEMLMSGELVVPHLGGRLYDQKPPLHFWTVAFVGWLRGGVDEVAATLPSTLSGAATAALVVLIGSRLFDRGAAWLAFAAFLGSSKILWQARVGQIDMTLTFLVVLAVWRWIEVYLGRSNKWWLFFIFAGLATLAKGPVGLLPPLLSIVVFLLVEREWKALRDLRVGRGLLIWAAVVAAWLVPAALSIGFDYFRGLVVDQSLKRYAMPTGHAHPWHYFLRSVPLDFLPMTVFLPSAALALRRLESERERRHVLFLVVWCAVVVVFFSLSPGKRGIYTLSCVVPLALLCGLGLRELIVRGRSGGIVVSVSLLLVGVASLLVAVPVFVSRNPEVSSLDPRLPGLMVVAVGLLGLGVLVGGIAAWRRQLRLVVPSVAVGMVAAVAFVMVVIAPIANPLKSARTLSAELATLAGRDEPYGIYPLPDAGFLFYSGRFDTPLNDEEELRRFVREPGRRWLLIERDELGSLEGLDLVEVARDEDWEEGHVLLTTRPWPRQVGSSNVALQ